MTKKKRCINKYTISDKWAQMIANYLFNIYLKLMENNIKELNKEKNILQKDYEWLRKFAELTDSASLFKLYKNFNKWKIISKENLDLFWKVITTIKIDDIYVLVNLNKESTIKYLKLWIKISNIFPYSRYSIHSFTEKNLDNFVDKIEDEERNKIWLFFTFLWAFIGFIALFNFLNNSLYLQVLILFISVFISILFFKQLLYLWKNISRKRMLLNLSKFLRDEDNINEKFLEFILDYVKKIIEYEKKDKQENLDIIKKDLDFMLLDNKMLFFIKSIFNLIKEYKLELIISFIISIIYLTIKLYFTP